MEDTENKIASIIEPKNIQFQNTQYLYLIEGDINNFKVDIKKHIMELI